MNGAVRLFQNLRNDPRELSRVFLVLWGLAALVAIWHVTNRYPPSDDATVFTFAVIAVVILWAPMPARTRLLLAVMFGLIVRLIAWKAISDIPAADDPGAYNRLAENLLAGRGLVIDDPVYGSNLRAIFPPLYPLLLAATKWLTGGYIGLNIAADLVAAGAILRLTMGSSRAASAYFLFPSVILASIVPSKECVASAILLLNLILLGKSPLAYGVLTGLLALTQPAWVPVPLVAFILTERKPAAYALAAIACVLTMFPWWVRNYLIFHQFVPLTSAGELSLAVAYNGKHVSTANIPLDEIGRAHAVGSATIAAIVSHPLHYLTNVVKMAVRAFLVEDDTIQYLKWSGARWLNSAALVTQASYAGLILWASRIRPELDWRRWSFVLAWLATCFIFGGTWLEFSSRHRAFAIPLLCLWIGWAWFRDPILNRTARSDTAPRSAHEQRRLAR
jgi:hypothetical protein